MQIVQLPRGPNQLLTFEKHENRWQQMEASTIFVVWHERCRRIFTQQLHDLIAMTREIMTEYKNRFTWHNTSRLKPKHSQCRPLHINSTFLFLFSHCKYDH
jgi:hypothetical protein